MIRILVPLFLMFSLSACAGSGMDDLMRKFGADPDGALETAKSVEDGTIETIGDVVDTYCAAPFTARTFLRNRLNTHPGMKHNEVGFYCNGDPALVLGNPAGGAAAFPEIERAERAGGGT